MSTPVKTTVKPARGLRVRKPDGSVLAEAGEAVTWSPYWQRRLTDGDIETVAPAPAKPAAKSKPARDEESA